MSDKKLTDTEIVKALENEIHLAKYVDSDYCSNTEVSLLKSTIYLINRLQAENKRLSTLAELGNTRADDYRVMRDRALKAEAENERLKSKLEPQGFEEADPMDFCGVLCDFAEGLIAKAKAEAYKEFAERLKMRAINRYNEFEDYQEFPYATISHIDNLLKELVGEDNA